MMDIYGQIWDDTLFIMLYASAWSVATCSYDASPLGYGYFLLLCIGLIIYMVREVVAARRTVSARQLASESDYRNYKTFSLAFKQRMGRSITAWMSAPPE